MSARFYIGHVVRKRAEPWRREVFWSTPVYWTPTLITGHFKNNLRMRLRAAGWHFLRVLLRFVAFTSKILCVSVSSLSRPSLLHPFPQRCDASQRSEASKKKNIWLHRPTAPCCGTVLTWGSTSKFHENPDVRSPPQHFLPNRMLRYKLLLLQKLQYECRVID